jgi:prolyl oligopeptidase
VVTSDRDQRVVPAHSYKFVAALQAAQGCGNPVLAHIEASQAGTAPAAIRISSAASELVFLVRALRMEPKGDLHRQTGDG